jgi:hypothetical protein
LLPKGYRRESFAGKKAHTLDQARIADLGRFVEQGQKELGIPGVALGLVQDGKVVFADGFGVKELGGTEKPEATPCSWWPRTRKSILNTVYGRKTTR